MKLIRISHLIFLALLGMVIFQNCSKDDDEPDTGITIEEYIAQKNLSPTYTDTGLGYIINNPGNATRAEDERTVKIDVVVKSTSDVVLIDTEGELFLNLIGQVRGLVEGIQLIGEGGNITLYVPSEIAWGVNGNSAVAPNADVIIEVSLSAILLTIEEYISDNSIILTTTTASGVQVRVEEEGDGSFPNVNSEVTVKYSGYFTNGDVFDSAAEDFTISLSQVIQGWREGIPEFSRGGKGKLYIPYEVAYGTNGSQGIPPRTDLIFDIELIDHN